MLPFPRALPRYEIREQSKCHGPLRFNPESPRRGAVEMPNYTPDAPERPQPASWLSTAAKVIFTDLVNDLIKAGVPIKAVDGHAIGMAATCLDEVQRRSKRGAKSKYEAKRILECAQMVARNQRDAQAWLAVIGATPKSRAQMGLRGKQEAKKLGTVASILAANPGVG